MRYLVVIVAVVLLALPGAAQDYRKGAEAYERGDYAAALQEWRPLAEAGDADSQYMLGRLYATGRGLLQDYVQAHLWFNLAAVRGKSEAVASRDDVAALMTPTQIAEAQRLARNWRPKTAQAQPSQSQPAASQGTSLSGRALVTEIQRQLGQIGYNPGPVDGMMGRKTRSAIRSYQRKSGLSIDGEPSAQLLAHLEQTLASSQPASSTAGQAAPAASTTAGNDDDTFSQSEILSVTEGFFGATTKGLAEVVQKVFDHLGRPTAYIAGEEVSGAFVIGLRYGKGNLRFKKGPGGRKIFWQGPTIGFDFGADVSKTFILVYGLKSTKQLYRRFPGVAGSFYFVAGIGVVYQGDGKVMLAPIRTGVGLRAGVNIGYIHLSNKHSWMPF